MVLTVLGSSSSGNCYLLEASDGVLILELGKPFAEVKKSIGWNLRKVVGALVSHRHGDHAKFLKDALSCGIRVLALEDVFTAQGITNRTFCTAIEPMHGYKVGGFKVFALPVRHDVPCLAFIIEHKEMGRTVFVTDTMMLEYKLPRCEHLMLEANYSDKILQENINNGVMPVGMRERLLQSHMEMKTTEAILRDNDLTAVQDIILLHLSARNGDGEEFTARASKASGKPVFLARGGMRMVLSAVPY